MVLIELHYLPCIAYFSAIFNQEEVRIEDSENYVKQSYRNRSRILSANKVESLSIPVVGGNKKILVRDIKIEYNQNWVKDHWRAIQSAYGRAPYFEYYSDYIRDVYDKNLTYLLDLNLEMLTLCLKFLQMDHQISFSEHYEKTTSGNIVDYRGVIAPKNEFSGYPFFNSVTYSQIFGKDFVGNLSVLDLLFCEGPNARTIIKKSVIS